ncbi:hypothetical protein ACFXP7_01970 [Microbacterium sp. P06]|uniref:hypothetical protein n=1 Tax=Microbacterium sp. P06 TaxID=3366949 RepID=UPI00374637E3
MRTALPQRRARRGLISGLTGVIIGGFVFASMTAAGVTASSASAAGEPGSDTRPVTITAADYYGEGHEGEPFPDLKLTVSQTAGLGAQGIEISWEGGKKSTPPTGTGGENFLQFAQCWGDDPTAPADKPRPDRTTCQYGAAGTTGTSRYGFRSNEPIPTQDLSYTVPGPDSLTPPQTSVPFVSSTTRDGVHERVERIANGAFVPGTDTLDVNQNQFFSQYTTNEISWAGSAANGTGSTKFEVQTAVQSRGLGCGRRVAAADGTETAQSCWLVAIPRGTADNGEVAITQSGLFWDSWQHHVAVRLDFRPLGSGCEIGAAERQVVGSELLATAVSSWQPSLCSDGGDIYNMITANEADAVNVANAATDTAPLALTSRPYSGEGADDLIYAPVGLSAVTVSFAIDRFPNPVTAPEEALERTGLPFTSMKLTPRLVAKLLSYSYLYSLPNDAPKDHLAGNPINLLADPEFLEINDPEWADQAIAGIGVSDMLLPQGRSDVALALWNYVLADADARAFLNGEADRWGMKVNVFSSTNGEVNPNGALALPSESFPKSDPSKVDAIPGGAGELNLITWRPYTNDLDTSGYLALRGDAQTVIGWDTNANPPRYTRNPRSLPGSQAVIALTDSAASEKYQIVSAALKNPAGEFTTPTTEAMTAAAAAMAPAGAQTQVSGFDTTSEAARGASSAYPLTMPIYAAVNPYMTDADARGSYAAFIRYAAGDGQAPGAKVGQLPVGYAPIPENWRSQSVTAANVIESGLTRSSAPAPTANTGPTGAGPATGSVPVAPGSSTGGAAPAAAAVAGETAAAAAPVASGEVAGALTSAATPADPNSGGLAVTLPVALLAGLASAGAVLIIPRLPRRT